MSLYNGPPRPGARGGRAEFSWDNVKSDKDREFYLGHSVKASVGRWQKGKDLNWYAKGKNDMGVTQDELEAVKAREREMMAEALGLKPKSAPSSLKQPALEQHEVERLLKGGADQEPAAAGDAGADADRIKGLGFNSGAAVAVREEVHQVLPGTAQPGTTGGRLLTVEQLAALEKASAGATDARSAGKLAKDKKKSKKEKKEKRDKEKKHKKEKRKHKRKASSRDSSSSSSSGDEADRRGSDPRKQQRHEQLGQPEHAGARHVSHYRDSHRRSSEGVHDRAAELQLPLTRGGSGREEHGRGREREQQHYNSRAAGEDGRHGRYGPGGSSQPVADSEERHRGDAGGSRRDMGWARDGRAGRALHGRQADAWHDSSRQRAAEHRGEGPSSRQGGKEFSRRDSSRSRSRSPPAQRHLSRR